MAYATSYRRLRASCSAAPLRDPLRQSQLLQKQPDRVMVSARVPRRLLLNLHARLDRRVFFCRFLIRTAFNAPKAFLAFRAAAGAAKQ